MNPKMSIENQGKIDEIEAFFAEAEIPIQPVRINQCATINDSFKYLKANIETARTRANSRYAIKNGCPYFKRLLEYRKLLQQ